MVGIENYIFLERGKLHLSNPSVCNQEFPYFPQISQYVSTLFPNTESHLPSNSIKPHFLWYLKQQYLYYKGIRNVASERSHVL